MGSSIRKLVVLGPSGAEDIPSIQDFRSCAGFFASPAANPDGTNTPWVRMWAPWHLLQQRGDLPPGSDQDPGWPLLQNLDAQIAAAKAQGLHVILTSYTYPRWSNGTASLEVDKQPEVEYQYADRVSQAAWDAYQTELFYRGFNVVARAHMRFRKALYYKVPTDRFAVGSKWAKWTEFLLQRYASQIDFLEITNEPNLQPWPLYSASSTGSTNGDQFHVGGTEYCSCYVGEMMHTAQMLVTGMSPRPGLMGPALADFTQTTRLRVPYDAATDQILAGISSTTGSYGFTPDARFAYTHHNYKDIEDDRGATTSLTGNAPDGTSPKLNRAANVRSKLLNSKWAGAPNGSSASPGLYITEGGARLDIVANRFTGHSGGTDAQAWLVGRAYQRMAATTGEGIGQEMFANYLFYSDPNNDSGLRNVATGGTATTQPADGAKRPVYTTWTNFPAR